MESCLWSQGARLEQWEQGRVHILLLSPFHGSSSHAAWAEGFQRNSAHKVSLLTLSDRGWSWRLKGASVPLSTQAKEVADSVDVILATSLTDLNSFFGLLRRSELAKKPTVYYMHENQLTYPIRPGGKRDAQLILRQFHSQLSCDQIWFNSSYNKDCWFHQLPKFLSSFPDHQGLEQLKALESKSKVMPVGIDFSSKTESERSTQRPLLLWNQRWEWEKGNDRFLNLLKKFGPDAPFDVVLLGGQSREDDPLRVELIELLGERLLHIGWCEREDYLKWLSRAHVTVSTARHEFFGISLLEAAASGTMTFLPQDLSYPELIPQKLHDVCLYRSPKDLYRKLKGFLDQPQDYASVIEDLRRNAGRFSWSEVCSAYDKALEDVAI